MGVAGKTVRPSRGRKHAASARSKRLERGARGDSTKSIAASYHGSMVPILDYVVVPISIVLVLGLGVWSHRVHGDVFALRGHHRVYVSVSIVLIILTLVQLMIPMRFKDVSQPLLIVTMAWAFGALIIAGLLQRRSEAPPSEPRA